MTGTTEISPPPRPRRLTILTFQDRMGMIFADQLEALFGSSLTVSRCLFSQIGQATFTEEDTLLAFSAGILRIVHQLHPHVHQAMRGIRSLNQFNLHQLLTLPPGQTILVVNDALTSTQEVIAELEMYALPHTFIPYSPESPPTEAIDQVITPDEVPLVPERYENIINLGTRPMSLATVLDLRDHFQLDCDRRELVTTYFKTLAQIASKRLSLTASRYVTPWKGESRGNPDEAGFHDLVVNSPAMFTMVHHLKRIAVLDSSVHISGTIGSGKRLIARMIHNASPRRNSSFASLHCSSRSAEMLERELFGWQEGTDIHPGILESNHLGTVCLEDVSSLPLALQNRLIQVIQERQLARQGGKAFVPVDVRIITTSHEELRELYVRRQLTHEIFLILQRNVCRIPPLSERTEDFALLVIGFLEDRFAGQNIHLTGAVMEFLKHRPWEGDVQELFNVLSLMASDGKKVLDMEDLPYHLLTDAAGQQEPADSEPDIKALVRIIEEYDFLHEILTILRVYLDGKRANNRYGRKTAIALLAKENVHLTIQQLRLRLERLQSLGLIEARKGRAGSTISKKGEWFLEHFPDHLR